MLLQRWDPLFDFRRRHYTTDRFVRGFPQAVNGGETKRWSIVLDAVEEDDKLVVRASLPGIAPEEIKVTIEDGVLTIDGETKVDEEGKVGNYLIRERRTGSFPTRWTSIKPRRTTMRASSPSPFPRLSPSVPDS